MTRYVIIGGGIAGTTAAEEIRKRDTEGEITIIDAEGHPCYSRVLLSHYAKGKIERERLFLKKPSWYKEKNIELMSGVTVTKIDPINTFVLTSEDRELPYDKLLITTGGELRLLPEDKRGVSYLRTLDDADHLLQLISEIKERPEDERRGIVMGAGFIGVEYINIFAEHDIPTTALIRSGGFWSKNIAKHSQKVIIDHVKNQGVEVLVNTSYQTMLGETDFAGLRLKDGQEIAAQILGVGIGLQYSHEIFTQAGLETAEGVIANEYLETNLENIYVAGDVAEFSDVIVGRRVRIGTWMNALMQARAVAKTMTGERTEYQLVPSYAIDILGLDIVFVGDTDREKTDEIVQRVSEGNKSVELFIRDQHLVGAVLIGDVAERQKITDAIKAKKMLE